jgi:hypothetical protein
MNTRVQRICAWCGPLLAVLFFLGFWIIADFIPPPSPNDSAQQVADRFREHANSIRFGLLLTMYAGVLSIPWVAAISLQLKRIEGQFSPLAYTQFGLGMALPLEFIVPIYFWLTAAYRSDRSPETIQTLNDLGWLPFTGLVYTIVLQALVVGFAVLLDKREKPIFPRWFGYFSLWAALLFCPAGFDVFFKDGPLAWNGLLAWWVLVVSFFVWLVVLSVVLLAAIRNQQLEELETPSDSAPDPATVAG